MLSFLPQVTQDELEELAQRYGQPLVRTIHLSSHKPFDPLNKSDRYGEVCMVVRRLNGQLLTMKKVPYPANAYRLLTGGINHGESIFNALLREVHEETGLEVTITHFLAAVAYHIGSPDDQPVFYTFAFLLDEISGTLETIDEGEQVEAFHEIATHELPQLAEYLDQLSPHSHENDDYWSNWGKFRAVIHRIVWEALTV